MHHQNRPAHKQARDRCIALLALAFLSSCATALVSPTAAPAMAAAVPTTWSAIRNLDWPQQGQTTNRGYGASAKAAFWNVQSAGGIEVYCQANFDTASASAKSIASRPLNIEHVAPADRIAEALGYSDRDCNNVVDPSADARQACKYAIADLHNMWPAYSSLNSSRGKLRYTEIAGEEPNRRYTEFCPDYERAAKGAETFVEPAPKARGNVARSLIYMSMVYGLPLDLAVEDADLLLAWHLADPPDADERRRETKIRQIQDTWNPLVIAH